MSSSAVEGIEMNSVFRDRWFGRLTFPRKSGFDFATGIVGAGRFVEEQCWPQVPQVAFVFSSVPPSRFTRRSTLVSFLLPNSQYVNEA